MDKVNAAAQGGLDRRELDEIVKLGQAIQNMDDAGRAANHAATRPTVGQAIDRMKVR